VSARHHPENGLGESRKAVDPVTTFETYQIVIALAGQFIIFCGIVWGVISYRFKAAERMAIDKASEVKVLHETEIENMKATLEQLRGDIDKRGMAFQEAIKNCVTVSVCNSRKEYEDKILGMLEKSLDTISKKLDLLVMSGNKKEE
jgi:hypothetical protein